MVADILVRFLVVNLLTGAPIPKAFVHCEGWGTVQDRKDGQSGWAIEYGTGMKTDSRGVAFGNAEPETTTCSAWKDSYGRVSQVVVITETNHKFTFKLPEAATAR